MAEPQPGLPLRTRVAARAGGLVGDVSRRAGLGGGTVIGGRVSLAIDPGALPRLAAGRRIALVSGTNGKTTTTRLLSAALASAGPVATNAGGANLPPGLVAALARAEPGGRAALEVDEAWMPLVADQVTPEVVVLLNLSRDQLDRVSEVRMLGQRWRAMVEAHPDMAVVANADDAIVAWAASPASRVVWVAAGQPWRMDAAGCPQCGGRIAYDGEDWACTAACGLRRPEPAVTWAGGEARFAGRAPIAFDLALPGDFNRANAVMAAAGAEILGVDPSDALGAMTATADVAGRYQEVSLSGVRTRLLLAKNPAGWAALLDLVAPPPAGVVVAINARIADGRDPSWLWDVPFERLAGRPVVASGERAADLAVRLRYAGVDHRTEPDPAAAVRATGATTADFIGNYTAFQALRRNLARHG